MVFKRAPQRANAKNSAQGKCCLNNSALYLRKSAQETLTVYSLVSGGAYFKVKKMNNIKCKKLVIFSFKITMKHKFLLSLNQI